MIVLLIRKEETKYIIGRMVKTPNSGKGMKTVKKVRIH